MSSSFDAAQDRPGRHRLVHTRARTLTPPRAAGFLIAATLTVLGITAAHQALSNSDAHEALSAGQGTPNQGPVAGQVSVPSSAYDNSPTPDAPAPDAPTPARLLAQSTPNNQPQPGSNAASTPSRPPVSHAATGSPGTPAQAASNGAAAQTASPSSPASQPPSTATQSSSSSPPASSTSPTGSSRPAPPVLSQVVGTVTGVLGGL